VTWFWRFADAAIERVRVLPTTQLRLVVTLGLVVGTGTVYLLLAVKVALFGLGRPGAQFTMWQPATEWLAFLLVNSGLDAAQFFAKRSTDRDLAAIKASGRASTTTTTITGDPATATTVTEPKGDA
jgi:hypothetical protein